ncbi:MAG: glycosyltransferase family 39 protein [Spirochaetaceae bacterium]|jgi:hypothetical protein|nr:glycosyltransferase family 39 protein [Spirochaetaceae bacterium]
MIRSNAIPVKIRNIVLAFSCIGIAGSCAALIPQVRYALIAAGEIILRKILHKTLNRDAWNLQLQILSIAGFLVSGLGLLCVSSKFPASRLPSGKKALYGIEIALTAFFLLETLILAAVNQSVWVDEAYSLAPVRLPWRELIRIQSADVHPPFYALVLKLWANLFGDNIFAMKTVSVLPALLTLLCVTRFLNQEFSRKSAVVFLLCSIASESIIHFSVEIRMYAWAFFFVTMTAISAWYIITSGKTRWYAAFLLFAEGAAYTHIYAGLTAGIAYLLLFCYVLKRDRKKLVKTLILAPLAVILYLPWLSIVIGSFTRAANDFWIQPITLRSIAEYAAFVFRAGNLFLTLVFFLLFLAVFVFFLKKIKTEKDWFAFASLSCIIILAGVGIAVSLAIRPLLVARYLFPAYGLVWLFFAIVCGSIHKRALVFVCGVLIVLGSATFSISLYKERKENSDFTRFYQYLKTEIRPQDIFIFIPKEVPHLPAITAYLFPGHTQAHEIKKSGFGDFSDLFRKAVDTTVVEYADLSSGEFQGRSAWIIALEKQDASASAVVSTESGAKFLGDFGWGFYRFKLYKK